MAETLTYTTPQTTTGIQIKDIQLGVMDGRVVFILQDTNGVITSKTYDGVKARNILHSINTSDNRTVSAISKAYAFLINDGVIPAGTVTGAPD